MSVTRKILRIDPVSLEPGQELVHCQHIHNRVHVLEIDWPARRVKLQAGRVTLKRPIEVVCSKYRRPD